MLPCSLEGTYKLYKNDTSEFVHWLLENGKKCGYSPPPDKTTEHQGSAETTSKAPRLKGKARKEAKEAQKSTAQQPTATRRVDLKELLPLANAIAKSKKPKVTVPSRVVRAGLRAIALRKKCSAYFQIKDVDEVQVQATDRHLHFISLMEDIILALQHLFEAKETSSASKVSRETFPELENRFSALEVEEPTQDESTSSTKPTTDVTTPLVVLRNSQDKEDEESEKWLAIVCIFEDLLELKKYIINAWIQYQEGKLDLITVSTMTNLAFQFARRIQEEGLASYPELKDHGATILLVHKMMPKRMIPLDLAYAVEHFCLKEFFIHRRYLPKKGWSSAFNSNDNGVLRSEEGIKNIEALLNLLREFMLICGNEKHKSFYIMDFLSIGLWDAQETHRIEIRLSFAVSCLVLISRSAGAKTAFDDLQQVAHHVLETESSLVRSTKGMRLFEGWESYKYWMQDWIARVTTYLLKDPLFEAKRAICAKNGHEFPEESERFYFLKKNPILCGMIALHDITIFHTMGLELVNRSGSALCPALLYHSFRHRKPKTIIGTWQLMEEMISVHTEEQFFLGGAPQSFTNAFKQACLACGISIRQFAPDRREPARGCIKSKNRRPQLRDPCIIIRSSEDEEIGWDGQPVSAYGIEKLLHRLTKEAELAADPRNKLLKKAWATTKKPTPIQLLRTFIPAMETEVRKLKFDYFKLHQQSFDIFKDFLRYLEPQEIACLPAETFEGDIQFVSRVPYYLLWLEIDQKYLTKDVVENGKTRLISYTLMDKFAEFFELFLERLRREEEKAEDARLEAEEKMMELECQAFKKEYRSRFMERKRRQS